MPASWTNITNAQLATGAPVRSVDHLALRDNAIYANAVRGQLFTANGTFTIPQGVEAIKVTVVGGGGGAAGNGGTGGGGGSAISYLTGLTSGATISVTVGAGGAGANNNGNGSAGGTSSIASGTQSITTVTCTGGGGGTGGTGGSIAGAAGTATNGTININGGKGMSQFAVPDVANFSFGGSSALFSNSAYSAGDVSGTAYGGGGACQPVYMATFSGSGKAGIVIFEW